MIEPSEAEIEAAAQAIALITLSDMFTCVDCRNIARAALTAAAQARERKTTNELIEDAAKAGAERFAAAAIYDQPMICRWCGKLHGGGPENCGKSEAEPAHAQSGSTPALMCLASKRNRAMVEITGSRSERECARQVADWCARELAAANKFGRLETRPFVQNADLIIAALREYAINPATTAQGRNG